jgi:soluble lytic murein transglycosylase-like protein
MQLMPETAKRYGATDVFDPEQNIAAGAHYLNDLMKLFNNNLDLTLAAYNAGENAVIKHGKQIPPYRETREYVPRVVDFYRRYQSSMPRADG